MFNFLVGLVTLLIPMLIITGFFAVSICKIPKHYALQKYGWLYFDSFLIVFGLAILLAWNSAGAFVALKLFISV